jgi:O-antigen ligase
MIGYSRGRTAVLTSGSFDVGIRDTRSDAVTLLTCYVVMLMAIPSSLVVGSFGAAGAPAGLFAAVLLCWYLMVRQHPDISISRARQPIRTAAVVFACAIVMTYVSANRTSMPVLQENGADRGLIVLSGWIGVLLLAADGIDREDRLRTLLRRIVLGASAMSVMGLMDSFTGLDFARYVSIPGLTVQTQATDLLSRDGLVRAMATTAEPLELAAVLAMCLPLAVHQARFAPRELRFRRWVQVALIAGTMPMTGSRSAFFGIAVIALVLFPTWPKRDRRRAYLALLTAPLLAWLAVPSILRDFGELFGQLGNDQSSKSRSGAFSAAVPYIAHHPWLGQGFHTFLPQIYFFVDDQYLTSLIETGVVGLAALICLFITGWVTARGTRFITSDSQGRDLAQSLAASVAAAAVCFASFDALSFSIAAGLYFLLLGCVAAAWRIARDKQRTESRDLPLS